MALSLVPRPLRNTGLAAVFLAASACAGQFDKKPFSGEDQAMVQTLQGQVKEEGDAVAKLELAKLYVLHNHLDEAKPMLEDLVAKDPRNAEALAWLGANTTKIAGRAFPWDMGIRKAYLAKKGLRQVEEAMALDSANFDVRVTSIITGSSVKRFGALDRAKPRMDRLLAEVDDASKGYTKDAKAAIYLAASHMALAQKRGGEAKDFAVKAKDLQPDGFVKMQVEELHASLSE